MTEELDRVGWEMEKVCHKRGVSYFALLISADKKRYGIYSDASDMSVLRDIMNEVVDKHLNKECGCEDKTKHRCRNRK